MQKSNKGINQMQSLINFYFLASKAQAWIKVLYLTELDSQKGTIWFPFQNSICIKVKFEWTKGNSVVIFNPLSPKI